MKHSRLAILDQHRAGLDDGIRDRLVGRYWNILPINRREIQIRDHVGIRLGLRTQHQHRDHDRRGQANQDCGRSPRGGMGRGNHWGGTGLFCQADQRMVIGKALFSISADCRTKHAVGESLLEFDIGIHSGEDLQASTQVPKLLQFDRYLSVRMQELLDTGALVRREGIIQIPGQQLVQKFFWE